VIYTGSMAIRIGLFVGPVLAAVSLVLLVNGFGASAGIAVAGLGIVAVASGTAFGYFADYLPELPRVRHARPAVPRHVDR
jgi:hypothetical protein